MARFGVHVHGHYSKFIMFTLEQKWKKNVENKMINTESWRFIQNETCGVMAVTRVAMASFVCP